MLVINCKKSKLRQPLNSVKTEICTRHTMVFGIEFTEIVSGLTIGVVCVGGLGILLIEQLMRLFPGRLVFIDKDYVDLSNLNRLIGATITDAKLKTKKTELAARNILAFNSHQSFLPIFGDFLDKQNQEQFKKCDFIFGATDSNAVRIAVNRLCLANGIPYLDCGSGATIGKSGLAAAGGQVIKILPDSGFCLQCAGLFDLTNVASDFMADGEKMLEASQGYIRGASIAAPQVYSLNMMIASQAIWFFQNMAVGKDQDFDVISIDAKDFKSFPWNIAKKQINNCPTCSVNGVVFKGDEADLLCREDEHEVIVFSGLGTQPKVGRANSNSIYLNTEFPIPPYPNFILGKNESAPFGFGLWNW